MIFIYLTVLIGGLYLLLKSAEFFVNGAADTARHFKLPPLLVGMVIIGFGTSAPEWLVSMMAALDGSAELALGNAYGSNIANIAFILGLTAIIRPIAVQSNILKRELPILTAVTLLSIFLLADGHLSRSDSLWLMLIFGLYVVWTLYTAKHVKTDSLNADCNEAFELEPKHVKRAIWSMTGGLLGLLIASKILIWSAEALAARLGISDLIIGLTVVAVGTSLPELASSLIAAKRGEHDLALGNIIGSNLFNTLCVVGSAGLISSFTVERALLVRDLTVMTLATVLLFLLGAGFRGRPGRINRWEGLFLMLVYVFYMGSLIIDAIQPITS